MQLIKEVEIAYFRSFYKEKIKICKDLNVIFGKNDAGKSNIVRALNLFFNNETDYGTILNFELDFADARKSESTESEDIRKFLYIKITFNTPKNYHKSLGEEFYVKRQWTVSRGNDFHEESSAHIKSNQKHIVTRFINLIKFIYVPAIKDERIFQNLLRDVYYCVANKAEFSTAVERFTQDVRVGTEDMFLELNDVVGSTTRISAPNRLEELFETLDFETRQSGSNYSKSLTLQRGDGVKARHIPELLRFISKNDGSPYHIWGFEEPENSLDFMSSASEAGRFKEIAVSEDIQIFLTTHNPSFYNISSHEGVSRAYVKNGSDKGAEIVQGKALDRETAQSLMDDGFFLPAIAEKLKEAQAHFEKLQYEIQEIKEEKHNLTKKISESEKPVLIVEGKTDKIILDHVFSKLSEGKKFHVVVAKGVTHYDIFKKKKTIVSNFIGQKRIFLLVDNDQAGIGALPSGFKSSEKFKNDESNGYYWRTLPLIPWQQYVLSELKTENPFFSIEDMFGIEILKVALNDGIINLKDNFRHGVKAHSKSFHDSISKDENLKLQVLEINENCKMQFSSWLIHQEINDETMDFFKELHGDILSKID